MPQSDLIFDVGMHLGEDTDLYLKKGFRVVAFEANSKLVQRCEARFSDAIASGRLEIVHGAVAPGTVSRLPFYVNTIEPQWGTLSLEWVIRNARRGAPSQTVEVRRIDIVEYFRQHGVPYYLKIDIEGSDSAAARCVEESEDRPKFISIETEINNFGRALQEIEILYSLGYRKFKPVQQKNIEGTKVVLQSRDGTPFEHVFERGASGAFGDDLPGEWLDYKGCRRAYHAIFAKYWIVGHRSPFYRRRWLAAAQECIERMIGIAGWHDLHASL
jgi:FkbM family methyltransferase